MMKNNNNPIQRDPLRIASTCVAVVAVILLIISTLFQSLAIYGTAIGSPNLLAENGWLLPVWIIALVLLPIAAIVNAVVKKKEQWPLLAVALALVGAVLALIVALELRDLLPLKAGSNVSINNEQGLDDWKLTYRHLSSVFAGGLIAIAAGINHVASRNDRIRKENEEYESVYDLSGDPLFADDKKLKRSKKDALRKESE